MMRGFLTMALPAALLALASCASDPDDQNAPMQPPAPETAEAQVLPFASPEATSRRIDVAVAVPDSGGGVDHVELWARPADGDWRREAVVTSIEAPVRVTIAPEGPWGAWEFAAVAVASSGESSDSLTVSEAAVVVPEPITITDRHNEVWEITHAVHHWGMSLGGWEHGLGRHTLRPIIEPGLSCPGDVDYLPPENLTVVLGVDIGGETRAYKLGDLPDVEVVDDVIAGAHIAVTY